MSKLVTGASLCAVATGVLAGPSFGSQTATESVRPGHSVLAVANIDFVGGFGYAVGENVTVEVLRGAHVIARASGAAADTPEGGGLEVNHGPEGDPLPGDCWPVKTPDLKPGDLIRITDSNGGVDQSFIDEVTIDSVVADGDGPDADDVLVSGVARYAAPHAPALAAAGDPIEQAKLDSGFWRNINAASLGGQDARGDSPTVTVNPDGTYVARYPAPGYGIFRPLGATEIDQQDVLDAGHEFGYGHAIVPPPDEIQLVDGAGEAPGPALGCEGSPAAGPNAITVSDDAVVNTTSGTLVLGGTTDATVTAVAVTLSDGTNEITGTVAGPETAEHGDFGAKGWTATFSRDDLLTLADGPLTATATFDGGSPDTFPLTKDMTVPPDPPAPGGGDTGGAGAGGAGAGGAAGGSGGTVGGTQVTPIDPATLRVFDLQTRSRVRLRSARRNGVAAAFNVPEGANVVRVELYRVGGAAQNRPLASVTRTVTGGSRVTIRLRSNRVRRQLRTGQYRLVVRAGTGNVLGSRGVVKRLRIVR